MERKKASDFPPEVLKLFDRYVHGVISRRDFLDRAATFAVGGPEHCSGLPVVQRSADDLAELFNEEFELVESCTRDHVTPPGATQAFTHALLARRTR